MKKSRHSEGRYHHQKISGKIKKLEEVFCTIEKAKQQTPEPIYEESPPQKNNRGIIGYIKIDPEITAEKIKMMADSPKMFRIPEDYPSEIVHIPRTRLSEETDVKLIYLPDPKGIRVKILDKQIAIKYILYRHNPRSKRGFVMKKSKDYKDGLGRITLQSTFKRLYYVSWVDNKIWYELDIIKRAFKQKAKDITKHLGVEVLLD